MNKQFFILPQKMTEASDLKPKDVLVYLYLKSYDNEQHECFPSLATLSKRSGAAINTIKEAINSLVENGYITIVKKGRSNYYYFNKILKFDKFSPEFLDNPITSFKEKAYIAASYQYMYKDLVNYGKISYSDSELAKVLNISESTIKRLNKDLNKKEVLQIFKESKRNLETGCPEELKVINLKKVGQTALWLIEKNTEDIEEVKEQLDSYKKLIDIMSERITQLENNKQQKYIL